MNLFETLLRRMRKTKNELKVYLGEKSSRPDQDPIPKNPLKKLLANL